jgi:PKD repeat protein
VDLVGITTPPTVTFTIAPDSSVARPVGTAYTFDASDTTDVEDYLTSLDLCWDWEDDGGGCDSTAISTTHSYASGGWHTARLTVTDTDGLTGTLTQQILSSWAPTATLNFTQTNWAQIEVDADGSDDFEDDPVDLKAYWDWDGDGVWDTGAYSITTVVTHTYSHIGRYWLTLGVEDTEGVVGTQTRVVDIIPPAAAAPVGVSGGTLVSTDGTVTVTLGAGAVSGDAVITHTPWITVPMGYSDLPGDFTYQGFSLTAQSLGGQPISGTTGSYTITIDYDLDYYGDVLGLWSDANMLKLYRWSGSEWVLVPATIDSGQLIATTDSFGDFALVLEPEDVYLPLVFGSY